MSKRESNVITLQQCEAVIKEGLDAFEKVGRALRIIEEMALYPEQYQDLEAYCDANWELPKGMLDRYAKRDEHVNKVISPLSKDGVMSWQYTNLPFKQANISTL